MTTAFIAVGTSNVLGQKVKTDEIQSVINATMLRNENISSFGSLICLDEEEGSLDGHLIFDQDFADSLAQDSTILTQSDSFNRTQALRGQNENGSIQVKTCFIAAKKSTKYRFSSQGHQELAVVAEAGGKVSMKIHVTNSSGLDVRYDDRKDVRLGRSERKASFELPKGKNNIVELEVVNCVDKDISVVVIKN